MAHTSSFNITSANEYFNEMVLPQYEDFIKRNSSSRNALLTIILVYHMYEWVNKRKFKKEEFTTVYPNHSDLALDFDVARKITNGIKHFTSKIKTKTQTGFSSGFSDAFARPLTIENQDGKEESVDKFLRRLVAFWEEQKNHGQF